MLIGEMEGSFFGFFLKSIKARRVLEIGTFTGYSALAMAEHLPSDGEVITLDIEQRDFTQAFWDQSPHGKKIKFIKGPALESLKTIKGEFDFVFIHADKDNYLAYLQVALEILSPNGVIAMDNVLWSGKVLEENPAEDSTIALKQVSAWIKNRSELQGTMLPIRDGIFLLRKNA
jgi:caffeoyl-CoA O-methyltransferase